MALLYEEMEQLSIGHDRGITKVAFSPRGSYLATAGLDKRVCIWDIDTNRLLYSFDGSSAVLSLAWIHPAEDTLLCGLHDGNMAILKVTSTHISVSGFWAHAFPVECLSIRPHDNRLASGAHQEVLVWDWDKRKSKFLLVKDLWGSLKEQQNNEDELIVTGLQWTSTAEQPSLLLVAYMYHGLLLFDARTWLRIRTVPLHDQIASMSISGDGKRLAISNIVRGFDVYSMETGAPLCNINNAVSEAYATPVLFVHGSLALLGGSTTGELHIWDVLDTTAGVTTLNVPEDGELEPRIMHTLPIPQRSKVLAVDAYYNEDRDEFFVAAGVMNENERSVCVVWKAVEKGGHKKLAGAHAHARRTMLALLAVIIVLGCAVAVGYVLASEARVS